MGKHVSPLFVFNSSDPMFAHNVGSIAELGKICKLSIRVITTEMSPFVNSIIVTDNGDVQVKLTKTWTKTFPIADVKQVTVTVL